MRNKSTNTNTKSTRKFFCARYFFLISVHNTTLASSSFSGRSLAFFDSLTSLQNCRSEKKFANEWTNQQCWGMTWTCNTISWCGGRRKSNKTQGCNKNHIKCIASSFWAVCVTTYSIVIILFIISCDFYGCVQRLLVEYVIRWLINLVVDPQSALLSLGLSL